MTPMTDYEAYKMYLALKAHFQTEKYNVIEQRGKIRSNHANYVGSGKAWNFQRLVKTYGDAEICDFMVANFVAGNNYGGVFDHEAAREYQDWKRRIESMRYQFAGDLDTLCLAGKHWFECDAGRHPIILKEYLGHRCSIETLVILNQLLGFVDEFDDKLAGTMLWPETSMLIKKYQPFLRISNLENYRQIYDDKIQTS